MDLNSTIPVPDAPFLRPDGRVTEVWWRFLLTLLNRTGGNQGTDPAVVFVGLDVDAPIPVEPVSPPLSAEVMLAINDAAQVAVNTAIAQGVTFARASDVPMATEMTMGQP